jgi:hypothetical protein
MASTTNTMSTMNSTPYFCQIVFGADEGPDADGVDEGGREGPGGPGGPGGPAGPEGLGEGEEEGEEDGVGDGGPGGPGGVGDGDGVGGGGVTLMVNATVTGVVSPCRDAHACTPATLTGEQTGDGPAWPMAMLIAAG